MDVDGLAREASKARRKIITVVSLIVICFGLDTLASGSYYLFLKQTRTDSEGYSLSAAYHVKTSTYAFFLALAPDNNPNDNALTKWVVTAANPNKEIFVGWTWLSDSLDYLKYFQMESPYPGWTWDYGTYITIMNINKTRVYNTAAPSGSPAQVSLWLDSAHTKGTATIYYDMKWDNSTRGNKAIIIMNLDGSANVEAYLQLGTKVPILTWLPYLLIVVGAASAVVGYIVFRKRRKMLT